MEEVVRKKQPFEEAFENRLLAIENRLEKLEKEQDTFVNHQKKVSILVSESTYHKIIDQVIELESDNLEKELEEEHERSY
mgnify:CR=1 FL=1